MRTVPAIIHRYLLLGLCLLLASSASASVLFPDDEADIANLIKPPTGVMVRWSGNASGVMISPNHMITTKHQGGGVGTHVWVNGVEYVVASEVANPDVDADIRVDRLVTLSGLSANLSDYVSVYRSFDEIDQTVTIGGFGRQRGSTLLTPSGTAYGYAWNGSGNNLLNWGAQKIDGTYMGMFLDAHFEAPGQPGYVTYEAGIAEYDSGGGWFVRNASTGRWSVVGLTHGAEHALLAQTWFGDSINPNKSHADIMDAIRVATYSDWILNTAMHTKAISVPGDANGDGKVNGADFSYLLAFWNQTTEWPDGDFTGDNYVDGADFSVLLANWTPTTPAADIGALPEPATLIFLSAGALSLLVRRRRPA